MSIKFVIEIHARLIMQDPKQKFFSITLSCAVCLCWRAHYRIHSAISHCFDCLYSTYFVSTMKKHFVKGSFIKLCSVNVTSLTDRQHLLSSCLCSLLLSLVPLFLPLSSSLLSVKLFLNVDVTAVQRESKIKDFFFFFFRVCTIRPV